MGACAGVYTDNQPDFSWLAPGETKTFSQYWCGRAVGAHTGLAWGGSALRPSSASVPLSSGLSSSPVRPWRRYPIQGIGPAQHANLHGALSLSVQGEEAAIGAAVTAEHPAAVIVLERHSGGEEGAQPQAPQVLLREAAALGPASPLLRRVPLPPGCLPEQLTLRVLSAPEAAGGRCLLEYRPAPPRTEGGQRVPEPATAPPAPQDVHSVDELFLTGGLCSCCGLRNWLGCLEVAGQEGCLPFETGCLQPQRARARLQLWSLHTPQPHVSSDVAY